MLKLALELTSDRKHIRMTRDDLPGSVGDYFSPIELLSILRANNNVDTNEVAGIAKKDIPFIERWPTLTSSLVGLGLGGAGYGIANAAGADDIAPATAAISGIGGALLSRLLLLQNSRRKANARWSAAYPGGEALIPVGSPLNDYQVFGAIQRGTRNGLRRYAARQQNKK